MKSLISYINEELTDNFIWKLSRWFEYNETQEKEFINIIVNIKGKTVTVKQLEEMLQNTNLYDNLKEFVNFMFDDIQPDNNKDYIYKFKQIVENTLNNKSKNNKYGVFN